MSAWFYILRLKSGSLYPGATTDLKSRCMEHLAGDACETTKHNPPTAVVYSEELPTFSAARHRESQIKRWSAKKKEALITGNVDALRNLAKSRDS
jgi:predicted GIY-YIG superfamily endonuclease